MVHAFTSCLPEGGDAYRVCADVWPVRLVLDEFEMNQIGVRRT